MFLIQKTGILSGKLVLLHFAPEYSMQNNFRKLPYVRYVNADLSSPLAMVKMDIMRIGFRENSFDAILCVHVLTLVSNDLKALQELYRVLKPGGWAIILSPVCAGKLNTVTPRFISLGELSGQGRKAFFTPRIYGSDYADILVQAGFKVKETDFVQEFSSQEISRFGFKEDEKIFFCTK